MRIVLDTNVLISALAFPDSKPDQILSRVRRGEVTLLLSSFILAELDRILQEKFHFSERAATQRIEVIRALAQLVDPTERSPVAASRH